MRLRWPRRAGARRGVPALLVAAALLLAPGADPQAGGRSPAAAGTPPGLVATPDDRGSFMTPCEHSHTAPDDPIVHPGRPGGSHRHEFFGATSTSASSTATTLLASETTCRTVADRSAYWVPALRVRGAPVRPTHAVAYYRVPVGADARRVEPPPAGLAMIAGRAGASEAQDPEVVHWSCGPRGEPRPVPVPCRPGTELVLRLTFPPCWDGENRRAPDHRAHVARLGADGVCPATHPVLLPELILEVRYPDDRRRFPAGEMALASGPLTGAHGDVLVAWERDRLAREIETCLHDNISCDVISERSRLTFGTDRGRVGTGSSG